MNPNASRTPATWLRSAVARRALARLATIVFATALAAGCGLLPEVKDETSGWRA
jgi:hypothetical protein